MRRVEKTNNYLFRFNFLRKKQTLYIFQSTLEVNNFKQWRKLKQ